jgi:hypothetical protein
MWKTMMIGATLAAAIASPALAQSYNPSAGTGNIVRNPSLPYSGPITPRDFHDAYAYQKPAPHRHYRRRWYRY